MKNTELPNNLLNLPKIIDELPEEVLSDFLENLRLITLSSENDTDKDEGISEQIIKLKEKINKLNDKIQILDLITSKYKEKYQENSEVLIKLNKIIYITTILRDIVNIVNNGEVIGYGGIGAVFSKNNIDFCFKIVHSDIGYNEEDGFEREAIIQSLVEKLANAEDVRCPETQYYLEEGRINIIRMEKINMITLADVIKGEKNMPESFDIEDFFRRVNQFVDRMHEQGIYHQDLHEGNIGIDLENGMPIIIDFGKSKHMPKANDRMRQMLAMNDQMFIDKSKKSLADHIKKSHTNS